MGLFGRVVMASGQESEGWGSNTNPTLLYFITTVFNPHNIPISHLETGCRYCFSFIPTSGHFQTGYRYYFSFSPILVL